MQQKKDFRRKSFWEKRGERRLPNNFPNNETETDSGIKNCIDSRLKGTITNLLNCVVETMTDTSAYSDSVTPNISETVLSVWFLAAKQEIESMETVDLKFQARNIFAE